MLYTPPRKGGAPGRAGNLNSCVLRVPRNASHFETVMEPHIESFGVELRKRRADKHASLYGDQAITETASTSTSGEKSPGGSNNRRGWQLARLQAHQELLELVATALEQGSRNLPRAQMRLESDVDQLPEAWGVAAAAAAARGGAALLRKTPDLVAADMVAGELLIVEVTIVPDAALGRYYTQKRNKYAPLCRAVEASYDPDRDAAATAATDTDTAIDDAGSADAMSLRGPPPVVIAVGTSGALHPASTAALRDVLGLDESQLSSFAAAAGAIAAARPGSSKYKVGK
eukprot:scaffold53485_cov63-Phaeocystis_antarctica.AAC.3